VGGGFIRLYFVTGNPGKLREARIILEPAGFAVEQVNMPKLEVQSDSIEEVARRAAESLRGRAPQPFFVEDSGLFIDALGGFPGPFSSYVYRTIGLAGVLRLMEGEANRRARFLAAVALCVGEEVTVYTGEVRGVVADRPRGSRGFGFDPIFIPEGYAETFAELGEEEKSRVSHRGRALRAMAADLLRRAAEAGFEHKRF